MKPLPIGTRVPHYGQVVGVMDGGMIRKRYYFLVGRDNVSLMPADFIEAYRAGLDSLQFPLQVSAPPSAPVRK